MDQGVAWVVRGYLNLNAIQRSEFVQKVNEYNQGNETTQNRIVNESHSLVTKMDMGPLTTNLCKCCGT
jgi:hypothetical protein